MRSPRFSTLVAVAIVLAATAPFVPAAIYTTLDDPSATNGTGASGVSGSTVVGTFTNSAGIHGFIYNGSTYTTLDDPSASAGAGAGTQATGVSGSTVVGLFYNDGANRGSSQGYHGFIYNGSTWTTLDDPAATNGTEASGVSGSTVVGSFGDASGTHGFITTVPEPATLGLLAFGAAGLLMSRRRAVYAPWRQRLASLRASVRPWLDGFGSGTFLGKKMRSPRFPALAAVAIVIAATAPLVPAAIYTTLDDPAATRGTYAEGVSGGSVVGYFGNATGFHGFLYNGSTWTTLDNPAAYAGDTEAYGVSGSTVVGTFYDAAGGHGFVYNGSTWTTLDDPNGGTDAYGVSGSTVVGTFTNAAGTHGFIYNGSTYTTLDDPAARAGSLGTSAYGVSGSTVVGSFRNAGDQGFVYNGSTYTTLDDPSAIPGHMYAYGVSGSTIVGSFHDATGQRGFVYDGSTWTTLDDPAATYTTVANGVSGSTVVGSFGDATGYHGFITTVPEPAMICVLAFGAAGLLMSRRRAVYCTTAPFPLVVLPAPVRRPAATAAPRKEARVPGYGPR